MIRILHILHSMNRGGAETMLMYLYRHIDREKVQFDFLLTAADPCDYEEEIGKLGGHVFRIPPLTFQAPWRYTHAVNAFFKNHPEYRIAHSHTSSKSSIPLWIAKQDGIPVRICHSHSNNSEGGIKGFVRDMLKPGLKLTATDFIACSADASEWLYGTKYTRQHRVRIVKNAIDAVSYVYNLKTRTAIREKLGLSPDTFVVGHAGRFHEAKNHPFLLKIFKEIHSRCPNSRLLLVGDGILRPEIEAQIKELGLTESVILQGMVPDVYNYMQAMDVFLFPSLYEGLGMVLIEAQAAGLHCFTSAGSVPQEADVTGNVEYIPLTETPGYWAEHVLRYNNGYPRENTYEQIARAGYDVRESAKELQEFYLRKFAETAQKRKA